MAFEPMFNFGSVTFGGVNGGADISFDLNEASGVVGFYKKLAGSFESNSGRLHQRTKGNRVGVIIDFSNCVDGTSVKMGNLFNYINLLARSDNGNDAPITIYPRYNSDYAQTENYSYDCFLTSDVTIEDWGKVNVGQSLTLEFESQDLAPILTSAYPELVLWEINDNGNIDKLEFNDNGTNVDAKLKTK